MIDALLSALPMFLFAGVAVFIVARPMLKNVGVIPPAPDFPEAGGKVKLLLYRQVARGGSVSMTVGYESNGGSLSLGPDGLELGGLMSTEALRYDELTRATVVPNGLSSAVVFSPTESRRDIAAIMAKPDAERARRYLASRGVSVG